MQIRRSQRALSQRSLLANFYADTGEIDPFLLRPAFADAAASTPRRRRGAGRPISARISEKVNEFSFY